MKGRARRKGKEGMALTAPDSGSGVAAAGAGRLLNVEAGAAASPAQSVGLVAAKTCGIETPKRGESKRSRCKTQ